MPAVLFSLLAVCFLPGILSRSLSLTQLDGNCPECSLAEVWSPFRSQESSPRRRLWPVYNALSDSDDDFRFFGQEPMFDSRSPASLSSMIEQPEKFEKRNEGPSLSVVNPVDVLRQRMLMEAARERMRQTQNQIEANAQLLDQIGKRTFKNTFPRQRRLSRDSRGQMTSKSMTPEAES